MKRIVAALLATLILTMAGCQSSDPNTSSASAASDAPASEASTPDTSSAPEAPKATIVKITIEGDLPASTASSDASSSEAASSEAASSEAASSEAASSEAASSEASSAASDAAVEIPEIPAEIPIAGEQLTAAQIETEMQAMLDGTGKYADLPVATIETNEGTIKIRLFPEQAPKAVENFVTHAKNGYYDGLTFHRVINDFMIQGGDPSGTGMEGESIWGAPFEDEFNYLAHNFRGSLSMANAGYATNSSQFFIVQRKDSFLTDEEKEQYLGEMFFNQEIAKGNSRINRMIDQITNEEQYNAVLDQLNAEIGAKAQNGLPEAFTAQMEPVMQAYQKLGGTPHLDFKHTVFGYVIEGMDVVDKIAAEYHNG